MPNMTSLTYLQAKTIAAELAGKTTKAAQFLAQMVKDKGRYSTFWIMRHGDPRAWNELPNGPGRGALPAQKVIKRMMSLTNVETGAVAKANTVRGLIDKMGAEYTHGLHVTVNHVINGRRNMVNGWGLTPLLKTKLSLKDPYGNEYPAITIRDLIKNHGVGMSSALSLMTGKKTFLSNGLTLASTPIDSSLRPRNWRFKEIAVKRGAATVRAKSVPALAAKLGIAPTDLYQMAYGFKTRPDMEIVDVEIERKALLPTLA